MADPMSPGWKSATEARFMSVSDKRFARVYVIACRRSCNNQALLQQAGGLLDLLRLARRAALLTATRRAALLKFLLPAAAALALVPGAEAQLKCVVPGQWSVPGRGAASPSEILSRASRQSVVLLGEVHDNPDHHRWQLQTVAALAVLQPRMALGFEAFPRRVQPVLDRWIAGELGEQEFLKAVDWHAVWGYDSGMYMPLFQFARLNRIPMIALNVDDSLPRAVSEKGFQGVPVDKREGITQPAPASDAYLDTLYKAYGDHPEKSGKSTRQDPEFRRFVEAQLIWDRAMAQAIAERLSREPGILVVGIMGTGHVANGYGVPNQLHDLHVTSVASLLPWNPDADCKSFSAGLATAVFGVPPSADKVAAASRPRLGISVETTPKGVRVAAVMPGSLAEATGIKVGDILLEAAGTPVRKLSEVKPIVDSVAPGTWLPLKIQREQQNLEVVARFPQDSKTD